MVEEMKGNMDFWEKYREVPENALKPFDNGKFKGTDINTIWRMKCLTEYFGMCGFGWYYNVKRLWTETCGESSDIFAFAEIELFVKVNGEWSKPISGTGGNKLVRETKSSGLSTSDEAYKMAITDAIGVACKNLGMGANVYWENDRTKYTQTDETRRFDKSIKKNENGGNNGKFEPQTQEKAPTIREAMHYELHGGRYDGRMIGSVKDEDPEYLQEILTKAPNSVAAKMIRMVLPPQQIDL